MVSSHLEKDVGYSKRWNGFFFFFLNLSSETSHGWLSGIKIGNGSCFCKNISLDLETLKVSSVNESPGL